MVSWTIAVAGEQHLRPAFEAFERLWARRGPTPAISVSIVAGLAHPRFLVEISAIAAVAVPPHVTR